MACIEVNVACYVRREFGMNKKINKRLQATGHMPAMPYAQSSGASRTHVSWTDNHQQVLCYLIDKLSSPPILGYPDFNDPFVLHTDASQAGLGAVLYQRSHGKLRLIARSEERRVGKECSEPCRSRWSPYH